MHPKVVNLYKRVLYAGRNYPQGLDVVREKAKKEFLKNKDITDDIELKKAIAYGRYMVREIVAIGKLHKYRQLRHRYYR
jgi:hypothetical protein